MTGAARVLLDTAVDGTDAMGQLGARLAAVLRVGDLVVLTGPLGAGKTTLTRGLGAALGARGQVSSPTFVLARTHPTTAGPDLVHVDAYRLSDPVEFDDLDLDWEASIVVVEWGRGMVDGISDSVLDVEITRATGADASGANEADDPDDVPDEPRRVVVSATGPRWAGVSL
ncbi:tRNA threonylcarbamoyladenosine biosynthesis protein TsaE [Curtobacterium sp. PhB191]|uniref:tRNA (adenosine(37)-N6)-threonylcarbamoyltransferase complex ATPase subunit type 1 TsaE n=1 Tax=Curtobacterium sp. PhB191 TaxID=2485202 RepID=UPI0010DC5596|nr:tRNA (adenosine(37)-N6)-threonylcarbamoyltransferase complex ATPase subunit type 1 TsaE [Curtobacterium sp. PhB191]TCU87418.1 tRNA threonylcarbamoyladenosine biosynthesis protein TsaE [Curtobacterium sp. PhB191]